MSAPRRSSVALVLLAMSTASAFAAEQSTAEQFLVIAQAHQALQRYAIEITVNLSDGQNVLRAEVECISAIHCARTIGGLTVLQAPKWTIAADRNRRTLTVAPRDAELPGMASAYPDPQEALTKWLEAGAEVSGGESTASGQRWVVKPPGPNQPLVEIFTDVNTHLLRRISYPANAEASQCVEILYRWQTSALDEARLDPTHYIRVQGKQIRAAKDYEGYRVVRVEGQ